MLDPTEARRKRLKFRSWHRGIKETDLILGRFADKFVDGFDAEELDQFEALLDESDPEIFDWVSGRAPVPPEIENRVTRLLRNFTASV
jgi:antitoxin CptB